LRVQNGFQNLDIFTLDELLKIDKNGAFPR